MTNPEGVIKYNLEYSVSSPVDFSQFDNINTWRNKLYQQRLIGQDPGRYHGDGFGNLSCRLHPGSDAFIITGSQTGHIQILSQQHYALVKQCNAQSNHIVAQGPVKPSSEALTHCAIYACNEDIHYVFHVHSPDIWAKAAELCIPQTGEDIKYGTPDMAREISHLVQLQSSAGKHIIVMKGHEDGVISYGKNADEAGNTLLNYLCLARM